MPWRAAAQGAKAMATMCSYPAINGVPACGNQKLIDEVYRGQFEFGGFVVSDVRASVSH